jgi:hypothetical protein
LGCPRFRSQARYALCKWPTGAAPGPSFHASKRGTLSSGRRRGYLVRVQARCISSRRHVKTFPSTSSRVRVRCGLWLAPNRDCDSPARKSGPLLADSAGRQRRLRSGGEWAAGIFQSHQIGRWAAKRDPEGWVGQARIMIDGVGVRVNVWKPTESPIVHAGVFGGFTVRANATAYGLDSGADWEQSAEMPESGLVCERCFPELWPGARSRAS